MMQSTSRITVAVVDDHPSFRALVHDTLARDPQFSIVAQCDSAEAALAQLPIIQPNVVLMDIQMSGLSGIECVRRLKPLLAESKFMMLTVFEDEDKLLAAFKAGARGYVLKGASASELALAVRAAANGEVYVSPSLAAGILVALTRSRPADPLEELTGRESEILTLVGQGLTNREIGERIHLSEKTVKHYITNILEKLQVRSRVEAALIAARHDSRNLAK